MIDDRLDGFVAVLRSDPQRTAILLDVDGTLAPITPHAAQARVPDATRDLLEDLADRYAIVACVSGRQAQEARRIVGIRRLTYVGNHGLELLNPEAEQAQITPAAEPWEARVRALMAQALGRHADAGRIGVWVEDKGPIQALHWRDTPDPVRAEAIVAAVAADAERAGLALHRGRMVLELRPPLAFDKGAAIEQLIGGQSWAAAMYAGDDRTDLDAFRGLRTLVAQGIIERAVCVAVTDAETPDVVSAAADVAVTGPDGVRGLLTALLQR